MVAACLALGTSIAAIAEHGHIPERRLRAVVHRGTRRRRWLDTDPCGRWLGHLLALLDLLASVVAKAHPAEIASAASAVSSVGWDLSAAGRASARVRRAMVGLAATERRANPPPTPCGAKGGCGAYAPTNPCLFLENSRESKQ